MAINRPYYQPIIAARRAAYLYVLLQISIAMISMLFAYEVAGSVAAYSAFLGGAIVLAPNLYLIYKALTLRTGCTPKAYFGWFIQGEVGKLGLTTLLLAIVLYFIKLNLTAFLLTFVIVQFMVMVLPLIIRAFTMRAST